MIEKQFCEELQELLDRYKVQLSVPTIMRNAQKIFHDTLSIRHNPELHNIDINDYLVRCGTVRKADVKWTLLKDIQENEKDRKL